MKPCDGKPSPTGGAQSDASAGPVESPPSLSDLSIKIFADGADRADILRLCGDPLIQGFTTNPTLMRRAGVEDYRDFARSVLEVVKDRPICFEVIADVFEEMERQAREISSWGDNVVVKIPVTNTHGESSGEVIRRLASSGVRVNVTAITTFEQVAEVGPYLAEAPGAIVSVFAGRIADTGRDPIPIMRRAADILGEYPSVQLLWASPREILNIFHADAAGCDVITVTSDLLAKLGTLGKDLGQYSLDTVRMFYEDAVRSGYAL